MNNSLKDKKIVVTGAGQGTYFQILPMTFKQTTNKRLLITGIGNELCKTLAGMGAKVIAVSRSVGPLEALKAECPTIEAISVDLSDWNATRAALAKIDRVNGLVNNAGIAIIKPYDQLTEKDFDEYDWG